MTIKEFKIQYALGTLSFNDKAKIAKTTRSKRILALLSEDKDWWVRLHVSMNVIAPQEILIKLSKDTMKSIQKYARKKL